MTRPEPKYKKVDKWVYGEVKEIELIGYNSEFISLYDFDISTKKRFHGDNLYSLSKRNGFDFNCLIKLFILLVKKQYDELTEHETSLLNELKSLRLMIAKNQNLPAFTIFHDSTLKQMSHLKPKNEIEMLKVDGVGQIKLKKTNYYII